MCREHQKTLEVINNFIDTRTSFKYDDLIDAIEMNEGTYRTSVGITIRMYLEELQSIGLLAFVPKNDTYTVNKSILKSLAEMAN